MTDVEEGLELASGPVEPSTDALMALRPPGGRPAISGGFWAERQRVNREVSLRLGWERLERAGSFENFRLAAKGYGREYHGQLFSDSDVYKWLEAVAWEQGCAPSTQLAEWQRECNQLIVEAQCGDGYLNTYFQVMKTERDRFCDLMFGHELYCAGHLMQAAVAQARATGDQTLVQVACALGDCLVRTFGDGRKEGVPGHPEIEMALVELSRLTGEERYRDLARQFIESRGSGRLSSGRYRAPYFQDHVSVREATTMEGHAVRALYLQCGATDVAIECHDRSLLPGLIRRWDAMVSTKMYLSGGVGSRGEGEAFGDPYELPPDAAYCESCASIASVMWAWRMLLLTGKPWFADLIERTMLNGILAGVSLDGERFAYVNPLQVRPGGEPVSARIPTAGRKEWFETACCPPNLMRMISAWGHYALTRSAAGLQLQQFATGTYEAWVFGRVTRLQVTTDYPWEGQVSLTVLATPDAEWELAVRVPGWCESATVEVNGARVASGLSAGYVRLERIWKEGDAVTLDLEMPIRRTLPHRRADAIRGTVALERGPLVYCIEQVDLPASIELEDISLRGGAGRLEKAPDPINGTTFTVQGTVSPASGPLYHREHAPAGEKRAVDLRAVPYFAWGNRELGPMRVWIPADSRDPPRAATTPSSAQHQESDNEGESKS